MEHISKMIPAMRVAHQRLGTAMFTQNDPSAYSADDCKKSNRGWAHEYSTPWPSPKSKHHTKIPKSKPWLDTQVSAVLDVPQAEKRERKLTLTCCMLRRTTHRMPTHRGSPLPPTDQCTDEKINKFQKTSAMEGSPDDQLFLVVHFSRTSFLF